MQSHSSCNTRKFCQEIANILAKDQKFACKLHLALSESLHIFNYEIREPTTLPYLILPYRFFDSL